VTLDAAGDEELKLLALNALQNSDPATAVPLLLQILQGTQSLKLKERALFVLAQRSSPEARKALADVARQGNPDLQRKAVDYMGVHGSPENRALLTEVYQSTEDVDLKRRILRAYMVAGDRARVLTAATSERNEDLRAEAVRQLGVMNAADELWQLYQKEASVDVKRQILQAMFVGGNATRLIELAKSEPNADLRRTAVRNLGLMRSSATGVALVDLYSADRDADIKRAAVQGLFIQNNAEALVTLARRESDPAMKRELVQRLSLMKSKAAIDYLMEVLGK
jgi:HEAT repeat protein